MKKEQLYSGLIVETRNKNKYLLVLAESTFFLIGTDKSVIRLEDYFSDLYFKQDSDLDIMKVYQFVGIEDPDLFNSLDNINDDLMLKLLWERKEPVEITMDQIAEKFGIPVELIKIKGNM